MKYTKFLLPAIIILFISSFDVVHAVSFTTPPIKDTSYRAKFISQSIDDPISIPAGDTKEVSVKMKNTGDKSWLNYGSNYVSAYTADPSYHKSLFTGSAWEEQGDQPSRILGSARPGQTAEVKIKLYAPAKAGDYTEKFCLSAENKTWIQGSCFFFKIKVTKAVPQVAPSDNTSTTTPTSTPTSTAQAAPKDYEANLLALSARTIEAKGGDKISFLARYQNSGTAVWNNYVWQEAGSKQTGVVISAVSTQLTMADDSWLSSNDIKSENKIVNPKGNLDINFEFRAPPKKGNYVANFQLTANDQTVDGATLELPVTVTEDAPIDYQEPVFVSATSTASSTVVSPAVERELITEPNIRVALFKAEDNMKTVKFQSDFAYDVISGEDKGVLTEDEPASMSYADGTYSFKSSDITFTSTEPIRLVPEDLKNYFTLTNYERRSSTRSKVNYNVYRGIMEFVYSPKYSATYVIDELPLDEYVAGIAETSDASAPEYVKALLVASRAYGYFKIVNNQNSKTVFDVLASTYDQLYYGYNSELAMPHVAQAEQDTYGEMVTYNGTAVITPYFAHSDGWTRTWTEAWGGLDKPWLQSVECVYDKGLKRSGHGVGMSGHDASERAIKDGWTFDQLLTYYYTGTKVEKIY